MTDGRQRCSLPRDEAKMDGHNFLIEDIADGRALISDGERTAWYRHHSGARIDMARARVKPAYIEAGAFCEAHVVTLTDGVGSAIFIPIEDD